VRERWQTILTHTLYQIDGFMDLIELETAEGSTIQAHLKE
jgi:hypothetical protein